MLDFASFKSTFKGDLYTPEDESYAETVVRWAKNAQRNAQVVAFVKDPEDVALALSYARANNLDIAISGGGHDSAGASSSEGLVVDLSRHMKSVVVDAEKKLAYIGGGATWADVDKAAMEYGLATVGATVNHVGVGGMTLGGGVGWLCGKHGLVIDNLVQATVVNSRGFILTASESENPELFFGIRGGGCNFGVVTELVFKLHPQRRTVYSGAVIYPYEVLDRLIEVTSTWWETASEKEAITQALVKAPQGPPVPMVFVTFFYDGSEAEGRENFKAFLEIAHVADLTKEVPYEELNGLSNAMVGYGQARLIKPAFQVKPELVSIKEALERVVALSTEEHNPIIVMEYFPLQKIMSVPNGTCAFVRSAVCNLGVVTTWTNNTPDNLKKAQSISRELAGIIAAGQKTHFKSHRGYGNYARTNDDENDPAILTDKAEVFYGANYARLQKLKSEHDPDNIFSKWFPITPAARTELPPTQPSLVQKAYSTATVSPVN